VASEERREARRAFWLFLAVAVVCTAQVGWWVIFQVGETDRIAKLQWGLLGAARNAVTERLERQYLEIWHRADSLVKSDTWDGSVPAEITSNSAVDNVSVTSPGTIDTASARRGGWTWSITGPRGTIEIDLDSTYPARFLDQYGRSFQWSGDPPQPGWVPWPGPGSRIGIRPAEIDRIEHDRHHEVIMFASEGSFFVVLIILGAYLIYRAVRQSAELRRRQQNFIAAVTHELKAPLASVKLYAETLERPNIERDKQVQYLGRMLEDVARLEELIDNILLAGRFERRGFQLKAQRTNLSADVGEYIEALRGFLDRNQFELHTEIEPDVWAVTDYDALRRVVDSIVENAVKYAGDCREAKLTLRREGRHVILQLSDCGAGIPPEELERVFDAFYRVGDEMTRKIKGTGLGLYLVREIVAAHDGKVQVSSEGNGKGTTVTVTLPGVE